MTPGAADDDAEDNLNTLLLISISTTVVKTIPRIIQMKNIRLNATTLGINCSSPFTIPGTKNIYIMTPDIIGLIAPPIILTVFITAAVPIISFGINKIIMASRVTNSPEPIPKKIGLIPTCSGVE